MKKRLKYQVGGAPVDATQASIPNKLEWAKQIQEYRSQDPHKAELKPYNSHGYTPEQIEAMRNYTPTDQVRDKVGTAIKSFGIDPKLIYQDPETFAKVVAATQIMGAVGTRIMKAVKPAIQKILPGAENKMMNVPEYDYNRLIAPVEHTPTSSIEKAYWDKLAIAPGEFNKGVFKSKNDRFVLKLEDPNELDYLPKEFDYASYFKNSRNIPGMGVPLAQFSTPEGRRALLMNNVPGKNMKQVEMSDFRKMTPESVADLYTRLKTLRNNGAGVDWIGKNVVFDKKNKSFGAFDISPFTRNVTYPTGRYNNEWWEDNALRGVGNENILESSASLRRNLTDMYKSAYENAYDNFIMQGYHRNSPITRVEGYRRATDALKDMNLLKIQELLAKSGPYKKGGVIEDPMGQYNHPGEITKIPSNSITMHKINYPVLGVPDSGHPQMMHPEGSYYFPEADYVTEYPMMSHGGPTPGKAHEMLQDGTAHGKPLTDKQKRYFGMIYGNSKKHGGNCYEYGGGAHIENMRNEFVDWLKNTSTAQMHNDMVKEFGGELEYMKKGGFKINPAHKGWCTPMSKSTCTGKRRQFAINAKNHFKKQQDGGPNVVTDPNQLLAMGYTPGYDSSGLGYISTGNMAGSYGRSPGLTQAMGTLGSVAPAPSNLQRKYIQQGNQYFMNFTGSENPGAADLRPVTRRTYELGIKKQMGGGFPTAFDMSEDALNHMDSQGQFRDDYGNLLTGQGNQFNPKQLKKNYNINNPQINPGNYYGNSIPAGSQLTGVSNIQNNKFDMNLNVPTSNINPSNEFNGTPAPGGMNYNVNTPFSAPTVDNYQMDPNQNTQPPVTPPNGDYKSKTIRAKKKNWKDSRWANPDLINAGMEVATNIFNTDDRRKYEKWVAQQTYADNVYDTVSGNRGDYTTNGGLFRPDQMVPIQFRGNSGLYQTGGTTGYLQQSDTIRDPSRIEAWRKNGVLPEYVVANKYNTPSYTENPKEKGWLDRVDDVLSTPQRAATWAVTGKYQNPSDALHIENKWGKMAADLVLDPMNLLGIGLLKKISTGAKVIEGVNDAGKVGDITQGTKKVFDAGAYSRAGREASDYATKIIGKDYERAILSKFTKEGLQWADKYKDVFLKHRMATNDFTKLVKNKKEFDAFAATGQGIALINDLIQQSGNFDKTDNISWQYQPHYSEQSSANQYKQKGKSQDNASSDTNATVKNPIARTKQQSISTEQPSQVQQSQVEQQTSIPMEKSRRGMIGYDPNGRQYDKKGMWVQYDQYTGEPRPITEATYNQLLRNGVKEFNPTFRNGGGVYNTYEEGGEYDLSPEEIDELRRQGYEIEDLG